MTEVPTMNELLADSPKSWGEWETGKLNRARRLVWGHRLLEERGRFFLGDLPKITTARTPRPELHALNS
jgi:hypothetical protein